MAIQISGTDVIDNSRNLTNIVNATSTNTGNAFVRRDASGNFSAGTITASLSGNATSATTASNVTTNANLTGDVTSSGNSTSIASNVIVNADINSAAAIAYSKLASMTGGSVLLGNASSVPTVTALSGDVTISNTGVTVITAGVVNNSKITSGAAIAFSKLASMAGGSVLLGNASSVPTATALSGDVTISNTGVTAIGAGVIVNADINASAGIVDTKLATISTAGKVSNSATTATSANTTSAIVARDGSGLFDWSGGTASRFLSNTSGVLNVNNTSTAGATSAINTSLQIQSNNTSSWHFRGTTEGVNFWYLHGNGASSWTSDARKKKNIETTRDGYLEDLNRLRVVKYNWINHEDGTDKELGLIAQEVEQVFPGLVHESDPFEGDDYKCKGIKGSVLPFMLLKALQEASARIEALESEIVAIKSQIS